MAQLLAISGGTAAANDPVRTAIRQAATTTGVPFDYLLRTAERESSLDPAARARTSTATGLFQFLDQTWLGVMKEAGPAHGFTAEAALIERRPDGRYAVADPAERSRILDMRLDPAANAIMGAEFSRRNTAELNQTLGRQPTQGELYMAHFLGAAGASRFLTQADQTPDAAAATAFPEAARANPTIFFERGQPRTFTEVRERLMSRHAPSETVVAAAAEAGSRADAVPVARAVDESRVFHSLFRGEGRGPVSGLVRTVWGGAAAQPAAFAAPPREPFFPSATLRVGLARPANALGAIAAVAPAAAPAAATAAEPARPADPPAAVPLPPERPVARAPELQRAPRRASPAAANPVSSPQVPSPVDLLAFTRSQRP